MSKKNDLKTVTPKFRVVFPKIFEPGKTKSGDDRWSVLMMFDKDADLTKMKEAAQKAIKQKWGEDKPKRLHSPFKDADKSENNDGEILSAVNEFMEGKIVVNANSYYQPGLVNEKKEKIVDAEEFYMGCYAVASVVPKAYEVDGNKGVTFYVHNVMKVADGEPLGASRDPASDFEEVEVETTEEISVDDLDL
jgi:hypothetical protein